MASASSWSMSGCNRNKRSQVNSRKYKARAYILVEVRANERMKLVGIFELAIGQNLEDGLLVVNQLCVGWSVPGLNLERREGRAARI